MSIQPNASLTYIGLAAPASSLVGIILNIVFYIWMNRKKLLNTNQSTTKEWQKFNEGRNLIVVLEIMLLFAYNEHSIFRQNVAERK